MTTNLTKRQVNGHSCFILPNKLFYFLPRFVLVCCSDQFKCDTKDGIGRCIDSSLLDNGQVDCLDQTDETSVNRKYNSL